MAPIEAALQSFLETMLQAPLDADGERRKLLGQKVKQGGIGLADPTAYAATALETSLGGCYLLINALKLGLDVDVAAHQKYVRDLSYQAVAA
jgi:hypothetical protein